MGTARDRSRFRWPWPMGGGWRRWAGLALALLAGFAAGAASVTALLAAQPLVKETVLLRTDLAGVDGKELIVSRFETAPGWAHGRHYHVGHELVLFDPADPSLPNSLMNIVGRSGAGKTFLAQKLALLTILTGGRVTVIDRAGWQRLALASNS